MNMPTSAAAPPTAATATAVAVVTETANMPTAATATATEIGAVGAHNGREARNLAEKHRRDKLNASIQELSTMVPHVAEATRRLDKTAVLRFAAHGLRLQYVFGKSSRQHEEQHEPQLTDALMQLLDSFFITLTCHGQIVLISASVEQLLGHCQSDLYGQSIMQITHPADQELMRRQLIPCDMKTLFRHDFRHPQRFGAGEEDDDDDADDDDDDDEENEDGGTHAYYRQRTPSPRTQTYLDDIDQRLRADRRCFTVRLARAGTRSEAQRTYEIVKIDGCFRRSDSSTAAGSFPIVSQLIRRSRHTSNSGLDNSAQQLENDIIAQAAVHGVSGNDIVLVALARIVRPPKVWNRLCDPNQLEYRTRHLIDGRIVDCDQRIGIVAGYMREEVHNLSPFSFIHLDDVRWVIVALRQMYDCNSDYGESCYRLITRNGHFIYLQTKGYLEIDKSTNKVHSFLCVNTLLNEEEGRRKVQEMKDKFSVIIKTKIPSNSLEDVPASQNPQQLERIVLYLIENLQKRHDDGSGGDGASVASAGADGSSLHAVSTAQLDGKRSTPPLSLVPPPPASVKNSITKSVSVVNVTAARNLARCHKSPSSCHGSEASLSPASSVDVAEEMPATESSVKSLPERASVLRVHVLPKTNIQTKTITAAAAATPTLPVELRLSAAAATATVAAAAANASVNSDVLATPPKAAQTVAATITKITTTATPLPATQMLQQHISVLKRLHASPVARTAADNNSPAKRMNTLSAMSSNNSASHNNNNSNNHLNNVVNTVLICGGKPTAINNKSSSSTTTTRELHTVLNSSLLDLDQSLHTIGQGARTLCQQRARLLPTSVPRTRLDQQLDAIIVEQHKQKKLLGNLKCEYSVHVQQQQHHHHHHHQQQQPQQQPQQ